MDETSDAKCIVQRLVYNIEAISNVTFFRGISVTRATLWIYNMYYYDVEREKIYRNANYLAVRIIMVERFLANY